MKPSSNTIYTVRTKIDPAYEDEFNEWQNEEHVPWLLEMKGYICCQRFIRLGKKYKYMNLWEIESIENHDHPEKAKVSNTPWGKRLRRYRKLQVDFYSQAYSNGGLNLGIESEEGLKCIVIDRINFKADAKNEITQWYNDVYIPQVVKAESVLGIRILNKIRGTGKHKLVILHYLGRMEEEIGNLREALVKKNKMRQSVELRSEKYRPLSPILFKNNNI